MADIRFTNTNPVATRQAMEFFQTDTRFVSIADVPLILVDAPAGKIAIVNQDDVNRDEVAIRARQHTEADKAGLGFSTVDYTTDARALEFDVSAAIESQVAAEVGTNLSLLMPRVLATKGAIHTEGRFSALWTSGSWYRTITGAASDAASEGTTAMERAKWNDNAKDPVPGIRAEIDLFLLRTGMLPTNLRMGRRAFTSLSANPFVRSQVAVMVAGVNTLSSQSMMATEQQLSMLLGVKVSVSSGVKNTAAQGIAASNAFIINGNDALLTFDTPGTFSAVSPTDGGSPVVDMTQPCGFARVAWRGIGQNGFQIRSFARPEIGAGGSMAHVLDIFNGFVIVNANYGTFFSGMR